MSAGSQEGNRELERRQLTVMFCDLVGSTALSQRLDPEDLLEVVRAYRNVASAIIARYDGFVARYVGDGILAYFGYPGAHEDDALRALHAALSIIDGLAAPDSRSASGGLALQVRIGIATGRVVVGDVVAEGAAESSTAWGATPNLAARLQQEARPDTVLISETTRALAAGHFEYESAPIGPLKGFDEPVRAWRVVCAHDELTRFDAARSGRMGPMVARDDEMASLWERWELAGAGKGQVVVISGEAGIGKSRLIDGLLERVGAHPHVCLRHQCSPYHANSPLHPFIRRIEQVADVNSGDDAQRKLEKLRSFMEPFEDSGMQRLELLADLLSIPVAGLQTARLGAAQRKDQTLAALSQMILECARHAPAVVLFEDAHWIDPTSVELLGLIVPRLRDRRVLMLITSRDSAADRWLGPPHVRRLQLERLDRGQSAQMLARLPGAHDLPGAVRDEILARAEGIPLFIEELVKSVQGAVPERSGPEGAAPRFIPATLEDSLMARLDQLGTAKKVAQVGAVIGREFSRELIARVAQLDEPALDEALRQLSESAVLLVQGTPPAAFVFRHALLQDAAYGSLLRSARQELHGRVAETLEQAYGETARSEPELVAHHYSHAGRPAPAARQWAAAAHRAIDRSSNSEALSHATRGIEELARAEPGLERDALELALEILRGAASRALSGFASSEAERSFSRARELAQKLGDMPRLIEARRGLFSCCYARGALDLAAEQAEAVQAAGTATMDPSFRMLGHWMLGCVSIWQGNFAVARRELEQAIWLYEPSRQRARPLALQIDLATNSTLHLGWLLWILGHEKEAIETSERAIAMARELAQPFAVAMALFWACATRASCGHREAVRPLLDELSAVTSEHRLRYLGTCARVLEAQELIVEGRCSEGVDEVAWAIADFRAQEAGVGLPWALAISAEGSLRLGRIEEGLATIETAFGAVARNGERHWEAELWRLKAELLRRHSLRDRASAQDCCRRAIEVARHQQARSLELRATASLALFSTQDGAPRQRTPPEVAERGGA